MRCYVVLKNVISEPQATHYILITQNTRVWSLTGQVKNSFFVVFVFLLGLN